MNSLHSPSWSRGKLPLMGAVALKTFCDGFINILCSYMKKEDSKVWVETCPKIRSLNHFSTMWHFYTPWKRKKTKGFLMFSEGIEMEHWAKISSKYSFNWLIPNSKKKLVKVKIINLFLVSHILRTKLRTPQKSFDGKLFEVKTFFQLVISSYFIIGEEWPNGQKPSQTQQKSQGQRP